MTPHRSEILVLALFAILFAPHTAASAPPRRCSWSPPTTKVIAGTTVLSWASAKLLPPLSRPTCPSKTSIIDGSYPIVRVETMFDLSIWRYSHQYTSTIKEEKSQHHQGCHFEASHVPLLCQSFSFAKRVNYPAPPQHVIITCNCIKSFQIKAKCPNSHQVEAWMLKRELKEQNLLTM